MTIQTHQLKLPVLSLLGAHGSMKKQNEPKLSSRTRSGIQVQNNKTKPILFMSSWVLGFMSPCCVWQNKAKLLRFLLKNKDCQKNKPIFYALICVICDPDVHREWFRFRQNKPIYMKVSPLPLILSHGSI
jgi:hypothetical protein